MDVVVKAEEFKNYLQANNLVIVHRSVIDDKELDFLRKQKELLKKDALTPAEIVNAKLLHPHLTTTHSIRGTKKITAEEKYNTKKGTGKLMICTSAIVRLRKQFGYAAL